MSDPNERPIKQLTINIGRPRGEGINHEQMPSWRNFDCKLAMHDNRTA